MICKAACPAFPDLACRLDPELPGLLDVSIRRSDGKGNALNDALVRQLTEVFGWLTDYTAEVQVVLLGSGLDGYFSTGLDMGEMREEALRGGDNQGRFGALTALLAAVSECPAYLIGVPRGTAVGGAAAMLYACDYVVADGSTLEGGEPAVTFQHPERCFGMLPWLSAPYILRRMLTYPGCYREARQYLSGASRWAPEACFRAGLVDDVWLPGRGAETFKEYALSAAGAALARVRSGAPLKRAYPKPPQEPAGWGEDGGTDPEIDELIRTVAGHLRGDSGLTDREFSGYCVGRLCAMGRRPQAAAALDRHARAIGRRAPPGQLLPVAGT
jgi:enoyl-CoA hydratase/carnithine racemase